MYEERLKGLSGDELDLSLREIFEEQRIRIAEYLDLPAGSEVILCPSGSDAEYIPVAMARSLHPNKGIMNGVVQLNEIVLDGYCLVITGLFSALLLVEMVMQQLMPQDQCLNFLRTVVGLLMVYPQ